ncbi:hypothetical protein ACF0H5_011384 [Mactra antiquata]
MKIVTYSKNTLFIKCGLISLMLFALCKTSYGSCSIPSPFASSTWHDSRHGSIVFSATSVSGIFVDYDIYGTIDNWDCHVTTFLTDGRILLRSQNNVTILFQPWSTYICLSLTEIQPSVSYAYYHLNHKESNALDSRVYSAVASTTVDMSTACDAVNGASGSEFAVLIKSGQEASSYIECPKPLLGRFDFTYTDAGGTTYCNDPSADPPLHMNVCSDKKQVQFDVACSQTPVYAPASVYCVYSKDIGGDTYVQLYNPGAVDNSATYRFSCMAISSDSTSATIVYRNCTGEMTSSVAAVNKTGNQIGSVISFTPYVFCHKVKSLLILVSNILNSKDIVQIYSESRDLII